MVIASLPVILRDRSPELIAKTRELERLNAELEQAELTRANAELEWRIEERTHESKQLWHNYTKCKSSRAWDR